MDSDKRRYSFLNWFFNRPRTTGLLAFLVILAMLLYITYQRHRLNQDNYSREMGNLLEVAYSNLDQALKNASNTALTLALTIQDSGEPANFDQVGRQLVNSNKGVDAVQLVPNGKIKYIYPLAGNEAALDYDILADTIHRPDLLRTIREGKMYFAGPFELKQGGQGIVGRLPVYLQGRFWGFSAVVIRLETMLKDTGLEAIDDSRYTFQLSGVDPLTTKEVFLLPDSTQLAGRDYKKRSVPDTDWTLYIISKESSFERAAQLMPLLLASLIFSVLFGYVIMLLLKKPQHLRAQVRKQAQKLIESESKFRSMFEQAAVGILRIDALSLRMMEVNEAFSAMTGYPADEMVGKNFTDLFHQDPENLNHDKMNQLIAGEITQFSIEKCLVHKSGKTFWVKLTVSPLWQPGEQPTSQIAIVQDITFEKSAQDEIVKSEARFKSLFEDAPLAFWEEDLSEVMAYLRNLDLPESADEIEKFLEENPEITWNAVRLVKIVDVNNRCLELHKPMTREQLMIGLEPVLDEKSVGVFRKQMAAMATGVRRFVTESEVTNPSGETRYFLIGWTVMRGHEGLFDRVVVFSDDISEQKAAQQIILNSRQRLENIINTIEGIVWECDADTLEQQFISAKTHEILGYPSNVWLADEFFWRKHLHPDDHQKAVDQFVAMARNKEEGVMEYRFLAADGRVVWIRDSISMVTENDRNIMRGIMIDVTANKEAEETTQRSLKLVSEHRKRLMNFSYIVSHNLRSHAANIQSIAQFLDMGDKSGDEQAEMISMLNTVSGSLNDTMINLNDLVNLQTNDNVTLETLNLREYINDAIGLLAQQVEEKQANIRVDIPADTQVVYNAAYLESVLHNLISNALRYSSSERKPDIAIVFSDEGRQKKLSVSDNGIGIDLERHGNKLFGMYKTFNGNPDARGIGLFMTKSQIESMGGTIDVESQKGVGTTFTITFGEPYKNSL